MSTSTAASLAPAATLRVSVPLDDAFDERRVGHKAAALADLHRAGFSTPDGVVVPVEAPDAELWRLSAEVRDLGPGPYAVRSSGVEEDGVESSFAGLFSTLLNTEATDVPDAVRACRASASAEQVTAYLGSDRPPRIAVLIQPMVRAATAGVVFTADPVSGERDVAVLEAVAGLGDALVTGTTTPETWRIDDARAIRLDGAAAVLDERQARRIAQAARAVAKRAGLPQDVEWAWDDSGLVLLQARPITALPDPPEPMVEIPIVVPPGSYWQRDPHDNPPQTAYTAAVFDIEAGTRPMCERFGMLLDGMRFRNIGGWAYGYLLPLGGKEPPRLPPRLAAMAGWLMLRVLPVARRRNAIARQALADDLPLRMMLDWEDGWRADLERRLTELRAVDPATLDDAALVEQVRRARAVMALGLERHFVLHGAMGLCIGEYVTTVRALLGWSDAQAYESLAGQSPLSTAPARDLCELARLRGTDAYPAAFEAYLRNWGWRAMRYEIAEVNLDERPDLVHALVADQAMRSTDFDGVDTALAVRRAELVAEASAKLSDPAQWAEFDRTHRRARLAYPVRESNEFWTLSAPLGVLRRTVLEVGSRLAARGQVATRDDVFGLEPDDAEQALLDGSSRLELTRRRRGELAWAQAHPGPGYYGTPPPPPDLSVLPEPSRRVMTWFMAVLDAIMGDTAADRGCTDALVRGLGASPGTYTGPVRVVMDENEFSRVRPGDVLVCPATSPVWSVIFPNLGALVTDHGGTLSHPAIIAREYGIPAVVDTKAATRTLRDGQLVTVDGRSGTVTVHDKLA